VLWVLTKVRTLLKIKIVGARQNASSVGDTASGGGVQPDPYSLKVRHKVDDNLWIFEDQSGQTYLAIKSAAFAPGWAATYTGSALAS